MVEKSHLRSSMAFSLLRTKHGYCIQLYLTGAELKSKVLTNLQEQGRKVISAKAMHIKGDAERTE